jgi:signal transduction histidine kinase
VIDCLPTVSPQPAGLDAHTLLAALQEPTLVTTMAGRIVEHNPAAAAFFAEESSLDGQSIHELLPFIPLEINSESESRRWQGPVSGDEAPHRMVEVSRATVAQRGEPIHVYVVHDISRLTELNWWREQLLYQVAHEIRGSMGVVSTALLWWAGLEDGQGRTPSAEMREIGTQALARVERLLQDLLSAGSIRAGRLLVNLGPMSAQALVTEAVAAIEPGIDPSSYHIDVELPSPSPWVNADAVAASRVLVNLLSNACKYSPAGEPILLEVEELPTGEICFAVSDHGKGIALEEQPWLFERFYRVKGTRSGGIGLGLAIAKGIVEAHGGRIGLESAPGQGTRVWFTLLRCEAEADDVSSEASDGPSPSAPTPRSERLAG